ncbi:HD domain-containing protein [Bifidobacterium sp. ESL0745]|uniref:HD domain-containing protein n=1 Tax=Bifidobacterium sp. ESL0745 TaxID=2983226 RepID=UPI0023F81B1A|nr:HD domain-containing protein [Bifidobacterium sp. ESL0745]MDF7665799.1 HD domain-containing protein [Bifidobacterium sp. ESL0745]
MTGYIPTLAQAEELHHKIAPSKAAYDLIHTHCVIIATITRQLVRRQNALFVRRCTLPKDAPELTGKYGNDDSGNATAEANGFGLAAEGGGATGSNNGGDERFRGNHGADGDSARNTSDAVAGSANATNSAADAHVTPATLAQKHNGSAPINLIEATVPPIDGVRGGMVPPRLLDENLAVVGAMLHDIGTYLVLKHDGSDGEKLQFDGPNYILHGLRGYDWLLSQGVDESIAQFARNHTGVGLTREQVVAQGLPLPPADYVPMNLEQEVVMVADKYNSKSIPPRFLTAEAYARKARRFGAGNEQQWLDLVKKYGVPDIPALAKQFGMKLDE